MILNFLKPILEILPENNKLERIWLLAKTDFKKRYYGTSLGVVWALINPLFQLLIYYFVFTQFFNTEIQHFPLYIFLGLILWMFFADATKKGLFMIHTNRYLLENIRINKYDIYTSGIISNIFGLLFNFVIYILACIVFGIRFNLNVLYFPLILLNLIILIYGINLILSIVFIYLRDFNHFWDIFLIAAFWINPIVYSPNVLYDNEFILYLNPIAGILINMQNSILYGTSIDLILFGWNYIYAIIILGIGLITFKLYSKKVIEIL